MIIDWVFETVKWVVLSVLTLVNSAWDWVNPGLGQLVNWTWWARMEDFVKVSNCMWVFDLIVACALFMIFFKGALKVVDWLPFT